MGGRVVTCNGLAFHLGDSPSHSQDLISNSPYCLPYNSYDVSSGNLVLDQPMIP